MRAHSIGVSVNDTKPETRIATVMVTANSRNTRPTTPLINSTGMKTATSEKVIDRMVKAISVEPFKAASNGFMPPSMWREMFSSITMASSTTKPTDSVIASSEMLSMEKPKAYIKAHVPISETGSANAGINVADGDFRNRKMTRTTRMIDTSRVHCTSLIDCRIETERSLRI